MYIHTCINSFTSSRHVSSSAEIFGNHLDPDQGRQKVETNLYPNILDALIVFSKHCLEALIKNKSADDKKKNKLK